MPGKLTFTHKECQDCQIVDETGTPLYTLSTTKGFFRGRKLTTITAARGGTTGLIDWRGKEFMIDGVGREWAGLKERPGLFSSAREWHWNEFAYRLEWHDNHHSLVATPLSSSASGSALFTPYIQHFFEKNEKPTITFPGAMQNETLRMFLLMAMLEMEMKRQDAAKRNRQNAAMVGSGASGATAGP